MNGPAHQAGKPTSLHRSVSFLRTTLYEPGGPGSPLGGVASSLPFTLEFHLWDEEGVGCYVCGGDMTNATKGTY